ncbi:MAG: hypothetical protein IJM84_06530 [Bacteroidaceae bacterium]|nr:hypothetical protein [Bacteroidaceae bacterium]
MNNKPPKNVLAYLIKSVKNELYQYPLLFAWEKYHYGAHWDFWEEGHSMFEYLMFESRAKEIIPQLIAEVSQQKSNFHPMYKEILYVYNKVMQDMEM